MDRNGPEGETESKREKKTEITINEVLKINTAATVISSDTSYTHNNGSIIQSHLN